MSYNFALQYPADLVAPFKVRKHPVHFGNMGYKRVGQSANVKRLVLNAAPDGGFMWNLDAMGRHLYLGRPCVSRASILHTVEEPADDWESGPIWFASEQATNSMHNYGDHDGDLYQLMDFNHPAWGHGTGSANTRLPRPLWWDGFSYNTSSHGLELEGYTAEITERWRDAPGNPQRASATKWLAFEAHFNGHPLDRAHVMGHEELATNKVDPGIKAHGFPIDELIRDARQLLGGTANGTAPHPSELTDAEYLAARQASWAKGWRSGWGIGYATAIADAHAEVSAMDPPPAPTPNPPLEV